MYDSWESRILLFIKGKKHGRMMLDLIHNGPLVYPTIKEDGQTRPKKYSELTEAQQLQDDCDVQAINIILHGSPMYPPPQQFTPVYAAPIHHQQHHTPVNPLQQSVSPQPFIPPSVTQQSQAEFPQLDSNLAVPMFQQGEDSIECINKAMSFLSVVASRFPPSNNQLRTSSNPRNHATIQDGRVTVQQVQGRQTQSYVGTRNRGIANTSKGNYAAGQPRVVKCYNCQGEGHIVGLLETLLAVVIFQTGSCNLSSTNSWLGNTKILPNISSSWSFNLHEYLPKKFSGHLIILIHQELCYQHQCKSSL
ncbi:hypothetical protein Tco_0477191 [Tanacetum coccineum]